MSRNILYVLIVICCCVVIISGVGIYFTVKNVTSAPPQQTTPVVQQDNEQQTPTPQQTTNPTAQNETAQTTAPSGQQPQQNTGAPQTDEQFLQFFNTAVNKIKTDAPGLKKTKFNGLTDVKLSNSLANSLVGTVKSALFSSEPEVTDIAKGDKTTCIEKVAPSGKNYVSQLTMSDVAKITHNTDGSGNYVIRIDIPPAQNPDMSSSYAKIADFLTMDDVINVYIPKIKATVKQENIEVNFSDSYAEATITPDGNVVKFYTFMKAQMLLKDGKIAVISSDVDATIESEATYSDFQW